MTSRLTAVFFYGLFMDEALLASKGIVPAEATAGYVDGYRLRIGARATLVKGEGGRAYGFLMTLRDADLQALYADPGVADYVPEPVSVVLEDGGVREAASYLLPEGGLEGTNARYAESLLALAKRLGFPDDYLRQIRDMMS